MLLIKSLFCLLFVQYAESVCFFLSSSPSSLSHFFIFSIVLSFNSFHFYYTFGIYFRAVSEHTIKRTSQRLICAQYSITSVTRTSYRLAGENAIVSRSVVQVVSRQFSRAQCVRTLIERFTDNTK